LFSEQVNESLVITDQWISALWDAVIDAGIESKTDLIILSDHGHLPYSRSVSPNIYLKDAGFIRIGEKGNLLDWDAYAAAGGLSSLVYLSRPDDEMLYNSVYALLQKMAEEGIHGFEQVFTKAEVKGKYGLDGPFSFVLETDGHTVFSEYLMVPAVRPVKNEDGRLGHSSHGHLPEKGPQPTFLAMGPSITKGIEIEHGHILDHAATFAKILGISFPQAHGKTACFVK
jgi:predicted AlkP superfamily pyrophosphatase or phosphodiesterase